MCTFMSFFLLLLSHFLRIFLSSLISSDFFYEIRHKFFLFFLTSYVGPHLYIFLYCTYIHRHIHTHILTHTHQHIHTFTHTHTLTHTQTYCRLCAARDMSLSMSSGAETDPRSNGEDETVGEMDVVLESTPSGEVISSTQRHKNSSSKPPYQAFLGQLYALIEGAIDSNRLVCTHVNPFALSPPSISLFLIHLLFYSPFLFLPTLLFIYL